MEKFLENLEKASKAIRTVDHLFYVTFPLVRDKKLLLKILLEIKIAIASCINSILQYEYLIKRITLNSDPKINLKTFEKKCAWRYEITGEEVKLIFELFNLVEKHKQSPFEFVRNEKIVILSESSDIEILTVEKIKEFLQIGKNILMKIHETMKCKQRI